MSENDKNIIDAEGFTVKEVSGPMEVGHEMTLASPAQQAMVYQQFDAARAFFLKWILSKFKMGVHYGIPPGCEPKGNVDPLQWRARPCFYKVGAMMAIDLFHLRTEFHIDKDLWEMLGKKSGQACVRCDIYRVIGMERKLIGEGHGVCTVGEKKTTIDNTAVKIAEKRAMVDAVLNAVPVLGELFTQDKDDDDGGDQPPPEEEDVITVRGRGFYGFLRKGRVSISEAEALDVYRAIVEAQKPQPKVKGDFDALTKDIVSGKVDWKAYQAEQPPMDSLSCPECHAPMGDMQTECPNCGFGKVE